MHARAVGSGEMVVERRPGLRSGRSGSFEGSPVDRARTDAPTDPARDPATDPTPRAR